MNDNDNGAVAAPHFVPLIDTSGAAKLLGLAPITLAKLRLTGGGPPYVQLGRAVRYKPAEVMAWAEARARRSTSDAAVRGTAGAAHRTGEAA